MAAGLPDRVDCARLAAEGAVLERNYELGELPRLQDLLSDKEGRARAVFAFAPMGPDRPGARVSVEAAPHMVCQRCLNGTEISVSSSSEIEFADSEDAEPLESAREIYVTQGGFVSLKELAEEELLLALPTVAMCATPERCGRAPQLSSERSRPFAALQDLLKKP